MSAVSPSAILKPVMATPPSTSSVVNILSGDGSACTAGDEAAVCAPPSASSALVTGTALFVEELPEVRVLERLPIMAAAGNAVAAMETAIIAVRAFLDSFIITYPPQIILIYSNREHRNRFGTAQLHYSMGNLICKYPNHTN